MNDYRRVTYRSATPGIFARIATAAAAAIVLVTSFFLGLFVFAVVIGLGLILAAVIGARIWWARRWLAKQARRSGPSAGQRSPSARHDVFDADFHEVPRQSRER